MVHVKYLLKKKKKIGIEKVYLYAQPFQIFLQLLFLL